jgi:hypothetical protein
MSGLDKFYDACKVGDEIAVLDYIKLHGTGLDYVSAIIYLSMGKNVNLVDKVIQEMELNKDNTAKTDIIYIVIESCLYNAVRSGDQAMVLYFIKYWDTVYIKSHPEHDWVKQRVIEHGITGVVNKLIFGGIKADGAMNIMGTDIDFDMVNFFLEKEFCDPREFFKVAVNNVNKELLKYIMEKYKDRNFLEEYKKNASSDYIIKRAEYLYNLVTNPTALQRAREWISVF